MNPAPYTRVFLFVLLSLAGLATLRATAGEEPARERVRLPEALRELGFGDPAAAVTIEYVAPIGDEDARPTWAGHEEALPHQTVWIFQDPTPVWRALSGARTRTITRGPVPGAEARLILSVEDGRTDRRLYFHYRKGWTSYRVASDGAERGGEWTFDAAADEALVALLSRTPPTAIGSPVQRVQQAAKPLGPHMSLDGDPLSIWRVTSRAEWDQFAQQVSPRYEHAPLELPPDFDFARKLLIVATLPPRTPPRRLDWRGARIHGDLLRWELGLREEEVGNRIDHLIGVFDPPATVRTVQIRAGHETASLTIPAANEAAAAAEPVSRGVVLRLVERLHDGEAWTDVGVITLHGDGHFHYAVAAGPGGTPAASHHRGTLPRDLRDALRTDLHAGRIAGTVDLGTLTYVVHLDDHRTEPPDSVARTLAWIRTLAD